MIAALLRWWFYEPSLRAEQRCHPAENMAGRIPPIGFAPPSCAVRAKCQRAYPQCFVGKLRDNHCPRKICWMCSARVGAFDMNRGLEPPHEKRFLTVLDKSQVLFARF